MYGRSGNRGISLTTTIGIRRATNSLILVVNANPFVGPKIRPLVSLSSAIDSKTICLIDVVLTGSAHSNTDGSPLHELRDLRPDA